MYDDILVPTDGSDHALRAATYGGAFARVFDATLHVVSVVDPRAAGGPFSADGLDDERLDRLESEAMERAEAAVAAGGTVAETHTAVRQGSPREEILAYGRAQDADLVVMGTQGRTGVDRYVAGSVAEGVVRHADVPVLTVRATERTADPVAIDDLLVPTDGSDAAALAVDHALAVAEAFDARVHALHVVNVGSVAASPSYTPPSSLLEDLVSLGETATERIATRAREAELAAETEVVHGFPAADILDYAQAHDVDMIAMGTAGRTGLNRFLLGSTTERIIRHADPPVLAVNARDRDEE